MSEYKEYTLKELLDKLPNSWDDFTLEQFQKVGTIIDADEVGEDEMFKGVYNSIEMVGKLLDISPEAIGKMPFHITTRLCDKLSFTVQSPDIKEKSKYQWKDIDEITTDDIITMIKMGPQFIENSTEVVKAFCKDKLTTDEIKQMPMSEVVTGFFLLGINAKKYMDYTQTYLIRRIVIMKIKAWISRFIPYKMKQGKQLKS